MGISLKPAPDPHVIEAYRKLSLVEPDLLRHIADRLESLVNWTEAEHVEFYKRDCKSRRKTPGLCWYINKFVFGCDWHDRPVLTPILQLMRAWPKYTGVPGYPVPIPNLPGKVHAAYANDLSNRRIATKDYPMCEWVWDMAEGHERWEGEYGESRRELARFLATELRKIADEQEAAPATA